jgi:hypothetical protein
LTGTLLCLTDAGQWGYWEWLARSGYGRAMPVTLQRPRVCARDAHPAGLVARCLAKDPSDRFPTARDLDRALAGCGCAAERDGGQ